MLNIKERTVLDDKLSSANAELEVLTDKLSLTNADSLIAASILRLNSIKTALIQQS
jgi:hypothetical protein